MLVVTFLINYVTFFLCLFLLAISVQGHLQTQLLNSLITLCNSVQIPINGTFDRPIVDWVAAGRGIGQLTVHRTLGSGLLSSFIDQFDETDPIVPQPIGDLPWAPT